MKRIVLTLALLLPLTVAVFAQPGSTPVRRGTASFTFGDTALQFAKASGTFMQSAGYTVITIDFSADGKPASDHLGISLMIQKAGPVDLNQPMGNGIGYWKGGAIYSYQKGKSQCTMTVTKLTGMMVEGTAECAVVNEQGGSGKSSLTNVKFFATGGTAGVS
jgi:hypothetical protein